MKYSYDDENPDEIFIEWDDVWSRKDVRLFTDEATPSKEYFNILKKKVISVRLPLSDGNVIEDFSEITDENDLDEMDIRIWQWFALTPLKHIARLRELGEAKGLSLFTTNAAAKEVMKNLAKTESEAQKKS